jgi:hypothetical protein
MVWSWIRQGIPERPYRARSNPERARCAAARAGRHTSGTHGSALRDPMVSTGSPDGVHRLAVITSAAPPFVGAATATLAGLWRSIR